MLVSPEGTTFYFTTKTTSPFCKLLGKNYKNALQQVLCKLGSIYYIYSSKYFGKYWFRNHVYLISSKKLKETNGFSKEDSFIKKSLWHRCFPVNFGNFQGHLFLQNTSGGCFLKTLIFEYFSVKLSETLFEINKLNRSCIG